MDDDELELEKASAWPMGSVHAAGLGLHALSGLLFVTAMVLGPQVTPELGEPMTTPRAYGAGVIGFGTILTMAFSTGLTVVAYRTVGLFPKWSANRQRLAMFAGLVLAHGISCLIGVAGMAAMITTTLVG